MHHHFEPSIPHRFRTTPEPTIPGFTVHSPATLRATRRAAPDRPSRRYRLPPTRAARSSRSRGVFFGPCWRTLSAVVAAAALVALTAALCSTSLVNSSAFNANPGPQLVASASLVPPPITALAY
ncbi:MAG: hypothetical protein ACREYB_10290 [Casimicrobiaceae bacterium]